MIPVILFTMRKVMKIRTILILLIITALVLLIILSSLKDMLGGVANLDLQKQLASVIFTFICFIWTVGIPVAVMVSTVGSGLVANEESEGTMLILSSKPLRRYEIVLGKFLGLFISTCIYTAAILCLTLLIFYKATGVDPESLDVLFRVLPGIFAYSALFIIFFAALSIFLSSLFRKRIPAVITLVFIIFYIFLISPFMLKSIVQHFSLIDLNYQFSNILYYSYIQTSGVKLAPSIQTYLGMAINLFIQDSRSFDPDIAAMPPSLTLNDSMSPLASVIYIVLLSFGFIIYSIVRLTRRDIA